MKFAIIPFKSSPYSQPFRYKKNWWVKNVKFGENGANMVRKFSPCTEFCERISGCYMTINPDTLVATEMSFILKVCLDNNDPVDII